MRRLGIVEKLALSSTIILCALGIVVTWYSLVQLRTMLYSETFRRVEAQSFDFLQANGSMIVVGRDRAATTRVLEEFTAREGLAYAVLEFPRGSIFAQASVPVDLQSTSSGPYRAMEKSEVYAMATRGGAKYFEVRTNPTEAFTGMNRDLDTMFALAGEATPVVLRLGIDERVLQRRLVALVWRNTPLYAAFVLLAVIVQIYLARRLVRPIATIQAAARMIAAGNLAARVPPGHSQHDEIGELIRNFNDMAVRLEENRRDMNALHAGLEQKVRERTSELEALNSKLEESDRTKTRFLSTVSHEFRTPLTSIKAASELLMDSQVEDPQTRTRFLTIINSETDRLTRLIAGLLDLAKIDAGMEFGDVDVRDLVRGSIAALLPATDEKGISVEIDAAMPCPVYADSDRIVQVINNVVGNALKFSTGSGSIGVKVSHAASSGPEIRTDGEYVLVAITDSGPGISESDLPHIFERFYRASNATREVKGTGLGLAICREIIAQHRGEIWAESTLRSGSTFFFTLPLARLPIVRSASERWERRRPNEYKKEGTGLR